MKKYVTLLVVLVIALIVLLVMWRMPASPSQAVADCFAQGGSFDVITGLCIQASSTPPTSSKPVVHAPTKTTVPKGPIETAPTYYASSASGETYLTIATPTSEMIQVANPPTHTSISSPLAVTGQARGSWYFEAVFPVLLLDHNGKIIAAGSAHAQNNWQTDNFVPFLTSLTFPRQASGSLGTLILKNDNESGLPANDKAIAVPVTFQ